MPRSFLLVVAIVLLSAVAVGESEHLTHRSDEALVQMDPAQALKLLEEAYAQNPRDYEVLYRLSGVWLMIGELETTETNKTALFEKSRSFAEQAIAVDSTRAVGYVSRAAALGKLATVTKGKAARKYANEIREDATKGIELSGGDVPTKALANFILGNLHFEISQTSRFARGFAGLGWAKLSEAERFLAKAVEIDPNSITYRLQYAKSLLRRRKKSVAAEQLNTARALPLREMGDDQRIVEIEKLLADL